MAIGFERRQATLIGAGDLPTARGQAAVADLSGISRLGVTIMANEERKRREAEAESYRVNAINDRIRGMEKGSREAPTYVGKDENGNPVPFRLPDGTPEYQAGYLSAFNSTQTGKFRQSIEQRFNQIQADVTAGKYLPSEATELMRSYAEGVLGNAPEHMRGELFEAAQSEIAQRSGLMVSQGAARDAELVVDDLVAQNKDDGALAASTEAAGGDASAIYARMDARIDDLVRLKRIGPKQAEIAKTQYRQLGAGQALTSRLARDLRAGLITPDDLDRFALAIENGEDFSLVVPEVLPDDHPGRNSVRPKGYRSTDVIGQITDERVRASMKERLTQAATDHRQWQNATAQAREFGEVWDRMGRAEHRFEPLPAGMKDDAELYVQHLITNGRALETDQGMVNLMGALQRLKFAPKGLVAQLRNMTNSGDDAQVEKAIQVYHMMTTLQDRWGTDVGRIIAADIPESDRDALDAYRDAYEFGVPVADIRQAVKKFKGGDAISIGNAIANYNTMRGGDAQTFNKEFMTRWQADFKGTYPLEAEDAFKRAFRLNLVLTNDAQHAFDKAYESVSSRFTASDIFVRGVVKTGLIPPTNPYGYEASRKNLFGGNAQGAEYEWLENLIREDLADARLADGTAEQVAQLLNIAPPSTNAIQEGFGWTSPDFLGRTVKLEPTGTSPTQPEFMLRMFNEQGDDMGYVTVEGPDGVLRPYTINPWPLHQQMTQKAVYGEKSAKLEQARDLQIAGKKQELWDLYGDGGAFRNPMPETDEAFDNFLKTIEPAESQQYLLDRKQIEEGFEKQRQKLEEEGGINLSKNKALDQTSLVMPRAAGVGITASAVAAIDAVIPDGTGGDFMMRVAAQESNFGKANGTFRMRGDKGIFQVNTSTGFREVVRQAKSGKGRVYDAAQKLKGELGLDVASLTPADLDKPIVSAAVARLYFLVTSAEIPQDVEGQARLWKRHYNTHLGKGKAEHFVRSASKVPGNWRDEWTVMPTAGAP